VNSLRIALPDDFHAHLRQGPPLRAYVARSAANFGRFLAMPNVVPPPVDGRFLADYGAALASAIAGSGRDARVLLSFKLVPGMGPEAVYRCAEAGAVAGKYYPAGATTHSSDGIAEPGQVSRELAAMQEAGLVLAVHGEDPAAPVLGRETAFLPVLDRVVAAYPRLRVVLEHLSGAEAVAAVLDWPDRVAATITAHHLAYTIDDLLGDRLDPSFYCKPLLKSAADRSALVGAACSGSPKFFFGSDSAPHPAAAKAAGAAGVYASPAAMPILAAVFEEAGALDRLEGFCSAAGARFYGLPEPRGELLLERREWVVPGELDGVVPLAAGRTLSWTAYRT